MKTIAAAATAHLNLDCTTLAACWSIEKRNGAYITGTEHDKDIIIATGDYAGVYPAGSNITASSTRSSSDASVDNMEVSGAVQPDATTLEDINVYDIESGNLAGAAVELFVCDWTNPSAWQITLQRGHLGEIARDSDGKYVTELRGMKQRLTQVFVRTYSARCQVKRFGDTECGFNLAAATVTGAITVAINRKRFNGSIAAGSPTPAIGAYRGGELTFTSGVNAGTMREVKLDDVDGISGQFSFWEGFPNDPEVGDAYTLSEGCDRLFTTCQAKGNHINFRGHGLLIQGNDALMRGPG